MQPTFVGGREAMEKFIKENIKYTKSVLKYKVEGKVFVSFVVNTDGSLSDIEQIQKSLGSDMDKEAKRVGSIMPPWRFGKQKDELVRVRYVVAVRFVIP